MIPIYTQTVGAGGASSVVFNNIPSIYTDLKLLISARSTSGYGAGVPSLAIKVIYNNDSSESLYSSTWAAYVGPGSGRYSGAAWAGWLNSSNSLASSFSSNEVYIPNYTSSSFKQTLTESAVESNETTNLYLSMHGQLYRNASAINSVKFVPELGNFAQYSTFTLYGIKKS